MSGGNENENLFLSWQGRVSGPFSPGEIRELLKKGKIHSLHKVQVGGNWVLLRDHLAGENRRERKAAQAAAATRHLADAARQGNVPPLPATIAVADDGSDTPRSGRRRDAPAVSTDPAAQDHPGPSRDVAESVPGTGMAIASFVLSLLFFLPFLNLVAWVLGLIFGRLALGQMPGDNPPRVRVLASCGVWISSIQATLFLGGMIFVGLHGANTSPGVRNELFLALHASMLASGIGALPAAGMLMLAVKLLTNEVPAFAKSYLAALLPTAVGSLCCFVVANPAFGPNLATNKVIGLGIVLLAVLFVVQTATWAQMIHLKDREPLGYTQASVASLFCLIVSLFLQYLSLWILGGMF